MRGRRRTCARAWNEGKATGVKVSWCAGWQCRTSRGVGTGFGPAASWRGSPLASSPHQVNRRTSQENGRDPINRTLTASACIGFTSTLLSPPEFQARFSVAFALRVQPMLDAPQHPLHKAGADIAGQKIQGAPTLEGSVGPAEPTSCLGIVADGLFNRCHDADHPGEAIRLLAAQPAAQALPVGKRAPWDDQLMKFGCAQSPGFHHALKGLDGQPGPDGILKVEVGPDVATESLRPTKMFGQSLWGHSTSSAPPGHP